uniref:5-demethoxyubiquinone hydroxylase, mitochondrial n=2 Tax=Canis lupus familiaris TaxID=9615 RepID=A0A8C0P1V8_CANLF
MSCAARAAVRSLWRLRAGTLRPLTGKRGARTRMRGKSAGQGIRRCPGPKRSRGPTFVNVIRLRRRREPEGADRRGGRGVAFRRDAWAARWAMTSLCTCAGRSLQWRSAFRAEDRWRTGKCRKMWDQEKDHLKKFNELMVAFRVRPTILMPFWNVVGFALGAGTALLGKEGAMACTVAVEESIAHHYNNQIRTLMEKDPEKYEELLQVIRKFRDEELEHHDIGLEHDAQLAPAYTILKNLIQAGCSMAIYLSERF